MAYEMRDNSGSLFKNNKPRNDKSPQWTGKAMIDGKMRFFDAWQKKDKNGNTWFSCSFKEMQQVKQEVAAFDDFASQNTVNDFASDDIPF